VNGIVDNALRALIEISLASAPTLKRQPLTVWIDTAFNGSLAIPRQDIQRLGLKQASITQAVLADGRSAELETFTCHLEWFGKSYRASRCKGRRVPSDRHTTFGESQAFYRLSSEDGGARLISVCISEFLSALSVLNRFFGRCCVFGHSRQVECGHIPRPCCQGRFTSSASAIQKPRDEDPLQELRPRNTLFL
jgi:hypothetical protein